MVGIEKLRGKATAPGAQLGSVEYVYEDGTARLKSQKTVTPFGEETINLRYGLPANGKSPDRVYSVISNRYGEVAYGYDTLGRLTSRAVTTPELYTQYTYEDGAVNGRTTARVSQVNGINGTFAYAYNAMGSITEVKKNGTVIESYTYDALGRLTAATVNGTAYAYTYDSSGNLLTHRRGSDTAAYVYGDPTWGDLLTNYNGTSISYDTIGNPLNWRDGMAMTWQHGRELATVTKGGKTFAYSYGADGVRTQKTVDGVTTAYYTVGGQLLAEKTGDRVLTFHYDEKGCPVSVELDGTRYFYCLNLQGDVVGLKTSSSYDQLVVEYTYDPWGKLLSITDTSGTDIGALNPLRYRGYYYDTETGFYFLQSRYYDPTVGRFINADGQLSGVGGDVQGYNLFAYCQNDPVNMSDPTGHWPKWIKAVVKWAAKNIIKPAIKKIQKALSKTSLTYSTGVNVSGTPSIWSFNGQLGVSIDTQGNIAFQGSAAGGVTGGSPGASGTIYKSVTNAPTVHKLNGAGYQLGASAGVSVYGIPVAAGKDFNIIPDQERGKSYYGMTNNVGFGTPGAEFHTEWGETKTFFSINVFDEASNIYDMVMEW